MKQYVQVLGQEDFIMSQVSGVEEDLFKGKGLGVFADIASTSFRQTELRSLQAIPEGLRPPERFLDMVALHLVKNRLVETGSIPSASVPLVLGIWGEKVRVPSLSFSYPLPLCFTEASYSFL